MFLGAATWFPVGFDKSIADPLSTLNSPWSSHGEFAEVVTFKERPVRSPSATVMETCSG